MKTPAVEMNGSLLHPNLVNAYDHLLIPLTNNTTVRLSCRFDQHYQNFAGFDSLEMARCYLHLFELTYRITPFGPEMQPHLRKCPLALAGYDLARYLRDASRGTVLLTRRSAGGGCPKVTTVSIWQYPVSQK